MTSANSRQPSVHYGHWWPFS